MNKHEALEMGYQPYYDKGDHKARSDYWKAMRKDQQRLIRKSMRRVTRDGK